VARRRARRFTGCRPGVGAIIVELGALVPAGVLLFMLSVALRRDSDAAGSGVVASCFGLSNVWVSGESKTSQTSIQNPQHSNTKSNKKTANDRCKLFIQRNQLN
jgi:hypothetical protein